MTEDEEVEYAKKVISVTSMLSELSHGDLGFIAGFMVAADPDLGIQALGSLTLCNLHLESE